jgi:hypothetical protein
VLKIFAVHYGLLSASASILTRGKRASALRKSLRTLAENFLMHAPAKIQVFKHTLAKISIPACRQAGARKSPDSLLLLIIKLKI